MKSETVSRLWTSSTGPLLYFIFINFSNSKYVLCKMSCEYLTWNPSSFQRTESQFLPLTPRVFHLTFVFHPLSALELWLPSLWIPLAPLCASGHLLCPCTRGWLCSFIYTWILVHRWGFINTDKSEWMWVCCKIALWDSRSWKTYSTLEPYLPYFKISVQDSSLWVFHNLINTLLKDMYVYCF